ncbi:MAG: hypothetical protein ACRDOA_15835 [Streptosporangiaceae bacterium]
MRNELRSRGEYAAEVRLGVSLEAVGRFEPRRAGLPEVSTRDAAAYLDARQAERPWLAAARDRSPGVQRLFAALDQGGGHAHIRHEGWVTEEMSRRRVAYLEDPAQLDPAKRAARIDGLLSGGQRHRCGSIATRIVNPDAFAVAIARGAEHPDVRAVLDAEFRDRRVPSPVVLPIAELLGPHGHRHCTGWQLEAVEGNVKTASERRDAALDVKAHPVETFDGGTITFRFGPNRGRGGYEIVTMYVDPPDGG